MRSSRTQGDTLRQSHHGERSRDVYRPCADCRPDLERRNRRSPPLAHQIMTTLTEYLHFHTKTHRAYVHITPQVEQLVSKSGVKEGMVLVSAMHITAGIYVN